MLSGAGASGVAVSEDAVRRAVVFAFRELKLVVEPGGAVALAAALEGLVGLRGRTAVVVAVGGECGCGGVCRLPFTRLRWLLER